ncbi:MAG: hypothetical protein E7375_02625 [Clostridiales bacterium]|nr:hypothetical protein [Clostridiales bacterium]
MKTKILWSGITGRTGVQAEIASKTCDFAEIVAGVCRSDAKYYNYDQLEKINEEFDVIVDFSHKDCFDKILDFAIKKNKVLISGTSGISEEQFNNLEKTSHIIPIFRGGNFRFEVENFINDVVEYSKTYNGKLKLIETHYKTKKVPSETAKVVAKRVFENTGKELEIESRLEYADLINDWRVDNLHCRVEGFEQLGKDILKIANMMQNKMPNGLYDLHLLLNKN